jgi:cytochrome P450
MFGRTHADELAANQAAAEFAAYVRGLIAQRRSQPQDDLISSMVRSDRSGTPMSDEELVSTIIVLLNAGHEATVHQIGNAVTTILDSGLDPAILFADDTATQATVEECLRICARCIFFRATLCKMCSWPKACTSRKFKALDSSWPLPTWTRCNLPSPCVFGRNAIRAPTCPLARASTFA